MNGLKLTAWLRGATFQCVLTAICILFFGMWIGPLDGIWWIMAMAFSAFWGGSKSLVKYERGL